MFQTITIHNEEDTIKLSCLFMNDKCSDVSLEWCELKDKDFPEFNVFWDNSEFLFNEFYQFLIKYKNDELTYEELLTSYPEIITEIDDDVVGELIEMFNEAIKQGWYEPKGKE